MSRVVIGRAEFVKPLERKREDVPLPEFGEGVVAPVWSFTAREKTAFERQFRNDDGEAIPGRQLEFRERLVCATVRDDEGRAVFQPGDLDSVGEQKADVVDRIAEAAIRVCGLSKSDVEKLEKNSESTTEDA